MKNKIFLTSLIILSLTSLPLISQAGFLPTCTIDGNCGVCDIIATGITIFKWILGMLGGLALLLFVWHGFSWITAMGNSEKIEAGKKGLISTIFGLVIVLASWTLVSLIITMLTGNIGSNQPAQTLFGGDKVWYEYCTGSGRGDMPCYEIGGECTHNAILNTPCTVNDQPGIYQDGLCLGNTAPNYYCCVPNP